jgi:RNA polymerase sigma-54 factor
MLFFLSLSASATEARGMNNMIGAQLFPGPRSEANPQLIAANSVLQLSLLELEQAITQELDENPALEMVEQTICPICGGKLRFGFCGRCSGIEFVTVDPSSRSEAAWDAQEEADPLEAVPVLPTLAEQLFAQLRLVLNESDHEIALYVVGNLDEHGYLALSVEDLADTLQVEVARVCAVLEELQGLEPAGIGARTLSECLLLQLKRLTERGIVSPPGTAAIIQNYLAELGNHQFEYIREALNLGRKEVEEAFLFIRANLHPYPAHHYYPARGSTPPRIPLLPSVIIYRNASSSASYDVEIVESRRFLLRLNPVYQRIGQHPEQALSPGELEHINHFLERARLFIGQLRRRSLLLHKVMVYLVDYQRDFLDHGLLHLHPLTQKVVADVVGVHVSTISRAVSNKFAQLPTQELIPVHRFFSAELRVQELIRQIIGSEDEALSDASIARLLSEQYGKKLSRQMVANYRVELGIPAARQRAILSRARGK